MATLTKWGPCPKTVYVVSWGLVGTDETRSRIYWHESRAKNYAKRVRGRIYEFVRRD